MWINAPVQMQRLHSRASEDALCFLFWVGFLIYCDQNVWDRKKKKKGKERKRKRKKGEKNSAYQKLIRSGLGFVVVLKYLLTFELLQCFQCHFLYCCSVFSCLSFISVICSITLTWSFFSEFPCCIPSILVFHYLYFICLLYFTLHS